MLFSIISSCTASVSLILIRRLRELGCNSGVGRELREFILFHTINMKKLVKKIK
jgi:hypothetical protein